MLDHTRLQSLGDHWLTALKHRCKYEFPGEGDKALCIVLASALGYLLAIYEQEPVGIDQLNHWLARDGYKVVKLN